MPETITNMTELGIQRHKAPQRPEYATYEKRLQTFRGWPKNFKQTPEMLAEAGFYYGGQNYIYLFKLLDFSHKMFVIVTNLMHLLQDMKTKLGVSIVMEDYEIGNQWTMYGLSMHGGFHVVAL